MALGEVDYGLIGVVGGLTAFIVFLNGITTGGMALKWAGLRNDNTYCINGLCQ